MWESFKYVEHKMWDSSHTKLAFNALQSIGKATLVKPWSQNLICLLSGQRSSFKKLSENSRKREKVSSRTCEWRLNEISVCSPRFRWRPNMNVVLIPGHMMTKRSYLKG